MNDHHMHYPAGFDPSTPRKDHDDGMELYPTPRKDCPICNAPTEQEHAAPPTTKRAKPAAAA